MRERFRVAFGLPEESVDHLVATSRKAVAQGLARLAASCATGDRAALSHWSHSLKGSLLNAGLDDEALRARRIEELAASAPMDVLAGRVAILSLGLAAFLDGS
ncbi:hypothetical protein NNJEOMEG_02504 [Fundidesulfovibrio magnetotacticus]|uniref:HPt domain-containing protein n=1 Tax=Fundidesulfovibrio magnetotacticus TaxID=2730080 RepID=A0A6V8LYD0_9BACT|nr:hypothetical protein NNJEOMEG_02504 [Fundidesulfovibrio magnetotacticus]